jgi:hypothetical protein
MRLLAVDARCFRPQHCGVPPDDLTEAEAALWDAFACGKHLDLRVGDPHADAPARGAKWGSDRTVRGEVISQLVLGAQPGKSGFVPGARSAARPPAGLPRTVRDRPGRRRSGPRGRLTWWTPGIAAAGCQDSRTRRRGDVFRHLVLARITEPSSELDSLRGPGRSRGALTSYSTLRRRPRARAQEQWWRQRLPEACAASSDPYCGSADCGATASRHSGANEGSGRDLMIGLAAAGATSGNVCLVGGVTLIQTVERVAPRPINRRRLPPGRRPCR